MQVGSSETASKIATSAALLSQMCVKWEGSAISAAQCKAQHCEVADNDSPHCDWQTRVLLPAGSTAHDE